MVRKQFMKRTFRNLFLPFSIFLLIIAGCFYRESIFSRADIAPSDVPAIVTADPREGLSTAPANTKISVRFTASMEVQSVEDGFTVTCDTGLLDRQKGWFDWFDNDRAFIYYPFPPYEPLLSGSEVSVTIDGTVQTEKELVLGETYQWTFSTLTTNDWVQPGATLIQPSPSATDVDVNTIIKINFDEPVLRSTAEASFILHSNGWFDRRSAENGTFTWNNDIMIYTPDEPLGYDTEYSVMLNYLVDCQDLAGNPLPPFEHSFHTMN